MAINFTNPYLDLLTTANTKKSNGKNFSSNSVDRRDDFSPFDSPYYAISEQMRREMQPTQTRSAKIPTLSNLLQTAQSELRNIFKQIGMLKDLANRAADMAQTDDARNFFQKDFYSTLGKINNSADNMNWDGLVIPNGNEQYKINQVSNNNNGSYNIGKVKETTVNNFYDLGEPVRAAATTQIKFQGNLNASTSAIESINGTDVIGTQVEVAKGTAIKLKDGSTVFATNSGTYTIGHSVPISSTISVYDSLGKAHEVPINMEMCPEEMIQEDLTNGIARKSCWKVSLAYDSWQMVPDDSGNTSSPATSTKIRLDDGTIVEMSDDIYVYFNTDGTFSHLIQEKSNEGDTLTDLNARSGNSPQFLVANNTGLSSADGNFGNHARDGAANASAAQISPNTPNTANVIGDTDTSIAYLVLKYTQAYDSDTNTNTAMDQKLDAYNYSTGLHEDRRVQIIFNDKDTPVTQYAGDNTVYPSSDGMTADDVNKMLQLKRNQKEETNNIQQPFSNDITQFNPVMPKYHFKPNPSDQSFININLRNMHTNFLGTDDLISPQGRFLYPFDQQRYDSFGGNLNLQNDWMDVVRGASRKNLNSINIMSQRNASIALRVLQGALEQVQNELRNVGSYIQLYTQLNKTQQISNMMNNNSSNRYNFL